MASQLCDFQALHLHRRQTKKTVMDRCILLKEEKAIALPCTAEQLFNQNINPL